MKDSTYNIVKTTLDGDETVPEAERKAILASCRNPSPPACRAEPAVPPVERWLSPKAAAGLLAVSLRTVQRLVRSGALPSRRVLGCRRIPASALAALPGHPSNRTVQWPSRNCTHPEDSDVTESAMAV